MAFDTVRFSDWADSTPTSGSAKGVTSGGVYTALRAVDNVAVTLDSTKVDGTVKVYRNGGMATVFVSFKITALASSDLIGTITAGSRPPEEADSTLLSRSSGAWGSASYSTIGIRVLANGQLRIIGNTADLAAGRYVTGSISYPIGG